MDHSTYVFIVKRLGEQIEDMEGAEPEVVEKINAFKFKSSYFIFWGVMLAVAVVMLTYFRKKKWL